PTGIVHVGLAIIAPIPVPALTVALGVLFEQAAKRRPVRRLAFNVSNHIITMTAVSTVAGLGTSGGTIFSDPPTVGLWRAAGAVLVYYVANAGMTAGALSLAR